MKLTRNKLRRMIIQEIRKLNEKDDHEKGSTFSKKVTTGIPYSKLKREFGLYPADYEEEHLRGFLREIQTEPRTINGVEYTVVSMNPAGIKARIKNATGIANAAGYVIKGIPKSSPEYAEGSA